MVPFQSCCASTFRVLKKLKPVENHQEAGQNNSRIIFPLGTHNKVLSKTLLGCEPISMPGQQAFGAIPCMCREEAIAIADVMSERCSVAGLSFVCTFRDTTDAFNAVDHSNIPFSESAIGCLLCSSVTDFGAFLTAQDGHTLLAPRSGVAQGSSIATSYFTTYMDAPHKVQQSHQAGDSSNYWQAPL